MVLAVDTGTGISSWPRSHELLAVQCEQSTGVVAPMSEMPDAAWMDWTAGGLAIVVFVGGLVMMFTGILTSKNR